MKDDYYEDIIEKFKRFKNSRNRDCVNELDRNEKISLLKYVEKEANYLLLELATYMLQNDYTFQTIYKGVIWNGSYDNIEEAIECYNSTILKGNIKEKDYSIEVVLPRDKKENGRATLKELCEEYQNKEYEKAINKIEELTELVEKMRKALK